MKSNISLSNFLSAEIYKVFHNKLVVMLLLSPLIVYLLVLLYLTFKGWSGLFDYAQPRYTENPWMLIWSRHVLPIFSFMLPLSVTILSYLICEIEFQNDNIRTLLSFPIVRWKSYLSKVFVLQLLIMILCVIVWVCFVLGGYLLGILIPEYRFVEYTIWLPSMQVTSRVLLASFSVGAIQLLISLLSRNFTLPILSCILLTAIALFVTNDPLGSYLPFVTYTYIASIRPIEELTRYTTRDVVNIISWGVVTLLGYMWFTAFPKKKCSLS